MSDASLNAPVLPPDAASGLPVVIVGSGMAGYTLARELRKLAPDQPVLIITADDAVNYAKPTLSNALAGKKLPSQIGLGDHAKMQDTLKVSIMAHTSVQAIDVAARQLSVRRNDAAQDAVQQVAYRDLVLAVGASPIRLPIAGDGAADVLAVNSLADYAQFRDKLDRQPAQRVLLLGAGLIGCEFANDLQAHGHRVTVVDLAALPLGRLLPAEVAKPFQQALAAQGIEFALGTTVARIDRLASGDFGVHLANGDHLTVDVVLSAVGLRPNLALAQAAGLPTARGIQVDQWLQTMPGNHVYAMGDCAEVQGHLLPYVMPIMQQARALAQTLAGTPTPVVYPAMPVAVKTPWMPLVVLPPAHPDVAWRFESLDDGLIARAERHGALEGFVLLGPTAGKQRLALTKQVADLLPLPVEQGTQWLG